MPAALQPSNGHRPSPHFNLAGTENGLLAIYHEHYQGGQIGRAGVEDLHRHAGRMSIHRVAHLDIIDTIRSPLAQPADDHVEGFGARMGMHRCLGPGGPDP